jgi:hypothetical protein
MENFNLNSNWKRVQFDFSKKFSKLVWLLKFDKKNYQFAWLIIIIFFFLQSVIMLVFREEKSPEDEIKAWQFWHSRQHSIKQRILDAGERLFSLSLIEFKI